MNLKKGIFRIYLVLGFLWSVFFIFGISVDYDSDGLDFIY